MNNKRFKNDPDASETSWLSVNKANRIAFVNDELCGIPFTNNGFYTLLTLNIQATKNKWAHTIPTNFPFLFVSGAEDPIGDFGKGVTKTVNRMQEDGFSNTRLKLYPHMRHEILNEDVKREVFREIEAWLEEHIS